MANEVQAYWLERTLRMAAQASACALTETPLDLGNPCATYATLHAEGADGVTLEARVVRPAVGDSHPVLLMFHDASRDVRGWHHMTRFVALGYAVVALRNRSGVREVLVEEPLAVGDGLGVAMRIPTCDNPPTTGRVPSDAAGAALAGTLDDALLLAALLPRLEGLDATRIVTWGEGLGGGLALAVASLVGTQAAMALNPLPCALGDGSATLDVARIAEGLSCPVLLGTGCLDLQAPPEAQDVLAAGLAEVHHIRYPRFGHERVNAFEDETFAFLVALQARGT